MAAVKMEATGSSAVSHMGYDREAKELHLRFANGATHVYEGVEAEVYAHAKNASSVGAFVNRNIRDVYSSRKG